MIVRLKVAARELRELYRHRASCMSLLQLKGILTPTTLQTLASMHTYCDRAPVLARRPRPKTNHVAHVRQHVMHARLQERFAYHKTQAGVNSSMQSLVIGTAAAQCALVERPCAREPILGCIRNLRPSAACQQHRTVVNQHTPAQNTPSSTCHQ